MSELKALIFDVDGTLANTERDGHRLAFNSAFKEFGLDWEWSVDLYGELLKVTGGKERIRHYAARYLTPRHSGADFELLIPSLHARKTELYVERVNRGHIGLRTGVACLLAEARAAGVHLAIATTTSKANVTALLATTLGLSASGWFVVVGAGDMVSRKKPAADIYRFVLDKLRLAPAQCVAIEDSANGLRSARTAGLLTVVTVNEYTRSDDLSGAALVVDGFGTEASLFQVLDGEAHGYSTINLALLRKLASA